MNVKELLEINTQKLVNAIESKDSVSVWKLIEEDWLNLAQAKNHLPEGLKIPRKPNSMRKRRLLKNPSSSIRVIALLLNTNLTYEEIGERVSCTKQYVGHTVSHCLSAGIEFKHRGLTLERLEQ